MTDTPTLRITNAQQPIPPYIIQPFLQDILAKAQSLTNYQEDQRVHKNITFTLQKPKFFNGDLKTLADQLNALSRKSTTGGAPAALFNALSHESTAGSAQAALFNEAIQVTLRPAGIETLQKMLNCLPPLSPEECQMAQKPERKNQAIKKWLKHYEGELRKADVDETSNTITLSLRNAEDAEILIKLFAQRRDFLDDDYLDKDDQELYLLKRLTMKTRDNNHLILHNITSANTNAPDACSLLAGYLQKQQATLTDKPNASYALQQLEKSILTSISEQTGQSLATAHR